MENCQDIINIINDIPNIFKIYKNKKDSSFYCLIIFKQEKPIEYYYENLSKDAKIKGYKIINGTLPIIGEFNGAVYRYERICLDSDYKCVFDSSKQSSKFKEIAKFV